MKLPTGPGRREGTVAGLAVSAGFVLAAIPVLGVVDGGVDLVAAVAMVGTPTIVTGALVGRLLGPRAWRVRGWLEHLWLALALAIVATSIGCLLVGFAIGVASAPTSEVGVGGNIFQGLAGAFILWPLGMLFFGWVGVPITFVAGLIWTGVMRAIRPRASSA